MEMTDYILLGVAAVALLILILRLVFKKKDDQPKKEKRSVKKDKKRKNKRIDEEIEIPGSVKEDVNPQNFGNTEYGMQNQGTVYSPYRGDDEDTVLTIHKDETDYDATVKINRKSTYVLLENIEKPNLAFKKPIGKELLIGRKSGCDIIIGMDKTISAKHCRIIKRTNEDYYIEDCNSSNGTYISDEKVAGIRKIKSGDVLEIGEMRFYLSIVKE